MVAASVLQDALGKTLDHTSLDWLGKKYEGKVRDNYTTADGRRFIVVTDRISAFDRVLGTIPFKGQVLNRLAAWWFEKTKGVAPNHVLGVPDPNVLECVECTPILVEMVMRAYATGTTSTSLWTHYERGVRVFCGHKLPEGLKKHQRLPAPILTPTTKAPKGEHDVSGSREEILATGMVTAKDFDEAAEVAHRLFAAGQRICAEKGLHSGRHQVRVRSHQGRKARGDRRDPHARLVALLAGGDLRRALAPRARIPSPSTRTSCAASTWQVGYKGDGEAPPIPDDVRVGAAQRYIAAYEQITGEAFVPDASPPGPRIEKNLRKGSP